MSDVTTETKEPKVWASEEDAKKFRPKLLELVRSCQWNRKSDGYRKYRDGMEEQEDIAAEGYKLLQHGRVCAGQVKLLQAKLAEARLGELKTLNQITLLQKLDALGIDQEYKAEGADPEPQALFHFRGKGGARLATLNLTEDLRA